VESVHRLSQLMGGALGGGAGGGGADPPNVIRLTEEEGQAITRVRSVMWIECEVLMRGV
jgi:hypothetical protein